MRATSYTMNKSAKQCANPNSRTRFDKLSRKPMFTTNSKCFILAIVASLGIIIAAIHYRDELVFSFGTQNTLRSYPLLLVSNSMGIVKETPKTTSVEWCEGIQLSNAFSDNVVLQHGRESFIYGSINTSSNFFTNQHQVNAELHQGDIVIGSYVGFVNQDRSWKISLGIHDISTKEHRIKISCSIKSTSSTNLEITSTSIEIRNVVFGDVIFCSGQSNMLAPIKRSFHQFEAIKQLREKTSLARQRIRILENLKRSNKTHAEYISLDHSEVHWETIDGSLSSGSIHNFSAVCLYTAMELIDKLGMNDAPPLGLVFSSVGGTQIESWIRSEDLHHCNKTTAGVVPGQLFNGMVAPFVNMTVGAWLWYQGESNLKGPAGNSKQQTGYGCEVSVLVETWRRHWANQNSQSAPFGIVELAQGSNEGFVSRMSRFRWSQTANYGFAPNPLLQNVFVARGYDVGDPWPSTKCYRTTKCCSTPENPRLLDESYEYSVTNNNEKMSNNILVSEVGTVSQTINKQQCLKNPAWESQDWFDSKVTNSHGVLHPRNKRQIASRLALGLMRFLYKDKDVVFTGPTMDRCRVESKDNEVMEVGLVFNEELLGRDDIVYDRDERLVDNDIVGLGEVGICVAKNAEEELACHCMEWEQNNSTKFWSCATQIDGQATQHKRGWNSILNNGGIDRYPAKSLWKRGTLIAVEGNVVKFGLKRDNFTLHNIKSIRYGWSLDEMESSCCTSSVVADGWAPCPPSNCPIKTKENMLPASPFFAKVVLSGQSGKCSCPHPQRCDG